MSPVRLPVLVLRAVLFVVLRLNAGVSMGTGIVFGSSTLAVGAVLTAIGPRGTGTAELSLGAWAKLRTS
jgi:hypothetical protein